MIGTIIAVGIIIVAVCYLVWVYLRKGKAPCEQGCGACDANKKGGGQKGCPALSKERERDHEAKTRDEGA